MQITWPHLFCLCAAVFAYLLPPSLACAQGKVRQIPATLPRYDLNIHIDVAEHVVGVRERVTWTNTTPRATDRIVFNNHTRYTIPDKDLGLLAKSLELLRLAPSEALDFNGPPCNVQKVELIVPGSGQKQALTFAYQSDNDTALEVLLPAPLEKGQSVTLDLDFTLRLPQRQGRWGQWRGVTFLAQWLPVVACYDPQQGWQPTPFIPWHQPFCNEAGLYRASVTLPAGEKLGCTGSIQSVADLGDGWQQIQIAPICARDFALFCSKHYQECIGQAGPVRVRCLHLPEHAFYGKQMVRIACEAIPVYSEWFGPYPYPEFTVVESYFGWNGNECGGLVMIDERMFGMPHMAVPYVDSLLTHEICHQWFYNVVGTDGYRETWMDEGLATYFCHRVMDQKLGANNKVVNYPRGLGWLPNIHRDDFRNYGMFGVMARGQASPTVQDMAKFGNLVNLLGMTYDRGSRIVGMIEEQVNDQLGPAGFLTFMKHIYNKYYFRILRVCDFQRELEAYTGRSWQEFFNNWLYGAGTTDWCIDRVEIVPADPALRKQAHWPHWIAHAAEACTSVFEGKSKRCEPQRVTVYVRQKGDYTEPTVLGFALDDGKNYQIRVPLYPGTAVLVLDDMNARVETVAKDLMRVEIILPHRPAQITVDPDHVLLDCEPANNHWKLCPKVRWTPLYTQLDETDITTAHDRWNVLIGPWAFFATYNNPWYTQAPMLGLRAGVYRTQQFNAGAYLAYRSNDRNLIAGVDGLLDHQPFANTQIGFNIERSLATLDDENTPCSRAALFARWVQLYSSSLYLPPFEYVEAFTAYQNRCLPDPRINSPGTRMFDQRLAVGLHYHKFYLTPYWDPEGGIALDLTVQEGLPVFGSDSFHQAYGQLSFVKYTPDPLGVLKDTPWLDWLAHSRWAFRVYGAGALPDDGQFYSLGGGDLFRGFDLAERQGSMVWVGSVEWRVPILRDLRCDCLDHVAGLRSIYGVAFYDVGNAYLNGKQLGPVAHAFGGAVGFDVVWLGLIERTMLRLDFAKTVNDDTPWQFWFRIQHPF